MLNYLNSLQSKMDLIPIDGNILYVQDFGELNMFFDDLDLPDYEYYILKSHIIEKNIIKDIAEDMGLTIPITYYHLNRGYGFIKNYLEGIE